jgi:DNA-binding transcriptional LysR family regulator
VRLLRSWPEIVPTGRAHVVDDIDRLVIRDYDYRTALGAVDDDILLVEWDLAVDKDDLTRFATRAAAEPARVRVAPYRLYHYSSGRDRPAPIWVHRRYIGDPQTGRLVHVGEGDPTCHLWGLGLTYLPRAVVRAYLDARPEPITDGHLSGWHYQHVERDVPIDWDVRPVHLHYQLPPIP